eukprot:7413697-Pyramimonas_sp.AAC.1
MCRVRTRRPTGTCAFDRRSLRSEPSAPSWRLSWRLSWLGLRAGDAAAVGRADGASLQLPRASHGGQRAPLRALQGALLDGGVLAPQLPEHPKTLKP